MNMAPAMVLQRFGRYHDVMLAVGVLGVLMIMMMPLPPMLMDVLLVINITIGVLILLTSLYVLKPMDFSVFPSLLLLTTLFRLALNIATTRLILLHGGEGPSAAGHVIQGFGQFVVGGNTVVGLVIFMILVLINFIVITKGSTRIAEVSARFTLDAMPGKQMAIDADLNAGLIDDDTARSRREAIAREADFYGSMDGASKFVRGDAVAGLIITAINLFGGLVIGTMQEGMALKDAVETYSLLTVGDGLVAQIPALIISTAAGIVITRAGAGDALPKEMATQFTQSPRIYMVASGALVLIALVPGLPFIPFMLMATALGLVAWYLSNEATAEEEKQATAPAESKKDAEPSESLAELLVVDPIRLEVGYGIIDLVDSGKDGNLLDRIQNVRRQVAREVGFLLPPVHIKDNLRLGVGEYRILVRGAEVARGDLRPRQLMAIEGEISGPRVEGEPTQEPAFGLPALWIKPSSRQQAELSGYTVVEPATVVVTHITQSLRKHAHEILDRPQVQELVSHLAERHPKIVDDLVPGTVSLGLLQKVLQRLLAEWVPIHDMMVILETLADYAEHSRDVIFLTERVRERLGRSIVQPLLGRSGELKVFTFASDLENEMVARLKGNPDSRIPLDLAPWQRLLANLSGAISRENVSMPVVLTMPMLRPVLAQALNASIGHVAVLSVSEIPSQVSLQTLSSLSLNHAG